MLQLLLLLLIYVTPQTLACKKESRLTRMLDSSMYGRGIHGVKTENKKYHKGCPKYTDIQPVYKGKRIAACFWSGKGHVHPLRGCKGKVVCFSDDTTTIKAKKDSNGHYYRIPVGSLVVLAGCRIKIDVLEKKKIYKKIYKEKKRKKMMGPGVMPGKTFTYAEEIRIHCNKPAAFECHVSNTRKKFTERWDTIGTFDNSMSDHEGEFEYTHKIGMDFKNEVSYKTSKHTTVTAAGGIGLGVVGVGGSITHKTGYDWKTTSSVVKSQKREYQTKVFVPGGQVLELQQIIGECPGAYTAHTEVIRAVTKQARPAQP